MTAAITPEMIPNSAGSAAENEVAQMLYGEPFSELSGAKQDVCKNTAYAAIAAALTGWEGMELPHIENAQGCIILPLPPQETSDAEFLNRYWTELNWDTDDADFERLFSLARRGAAAGELLEALRGVLASIAMATVASCECLTKTPEPSFHEGHCRYRMLETAARTLVAAIARFEALTTQEKTDG